MAFFGRQPDQRHQTDLEVDVVGESYQPGGEQGAEQGERYGGDHRKRQAPAFVLGSQNQEDHHDTETKGHACAACGRFLLIGGAGPLQLGVVAKSLIGDLFQRGDGLTRAVARGGLGHDLGGLEDVEAFDQFGAGGITHCHQTAERDHLPLVGADIDVADVALLGAIVCLGLQLHPVGTAELVEVVDIDLAEGGLHGVEYRVDR